ncbi:dephospho-CoA kinase, partial [Sodalis-like endosymbiont of Proechinophthirus fluctus]|uniref:dephospho-CoA kinase n=1 Tax=Sodalis-like endosymbiont of Proechinophthirus fluctus TaxID=1462730 RepID=UPI0007A7FBEA
PLVDADVIAREVVEPDGPALRAIAQHFGRVVLNADGSLDRAMLRARIFSDPEEKVWLNGLLHPLIKRQSEQQLRSARAPYVLWVVPLLIENNLQQHADRVLVVDVDPEVHIARTLSRDGVNREQVESILAAQVPRQWRLACADDIIDNSGHPEEITDRIATLHQYYLTLAASAT